MINVANMLTVFAGLWLVMWPGSLFAESPESLARQSEAKTVITSKTHPTPQMIMEKVNQAAALLEERGTDALPLFKGKDSPFIFAGTYIWIHDDEGVMRMHPIKYKLEGKNLIRLRDANGKRFFAAMNKKVKENGAGWVNYTWPKPGAKGPSQKVSYVKGVNIDGKMYVVGCAVYDLPEGEMESLLKQDPSDQP